MTDQPIEITDESRISRRNALKAAAAVGVGAVAWSGPQISAFGATPAYAAACTSFAVDEFIDGRNTNQGNENCSPVDEDFTYQDDPFAGGLSANSGGKVSWNWPASGQVCPGKTITLTINDAELTCWVELWLYPSASGFTNYYEYHRFGPSTGTLPFVLPNGSDDGDDPTPPGVPGNKYASTNFAIRVRCIDKDKTECYPEFPK